MKDAKEETYLIVRCVKKREFWVESEFSCAISMKAEEGIGIWIVQRAGRHPLG